MSYGQFCPIAKAMEVLGEKWTLLIVRELLMGARRFNDFQRGLGQISPSLLTKRLSQLESKGLLVKRRLPGQKSFEYLPTEACRELLPLLEQAGTWGMRWARSQMQDNDFDLNLLMLYLQRSIRPDKLIGQETVIRFNFTDVSEYQFWWLVVTGAEVDVCVNDPGREVDVYFNVDLRTMCELWMGEVSYKKAIAEKRLQLLGVPALTRTVTQWLAPSIFAGIPPAHVIAEPACRRSAGSCPQTGASHPSALRLPVWNMDRGENVCTTFQRASFGGCCDLARDDSGHAGGAMRPEYDVYLRPLEVLQTIVPGTGEEFSRSPPGR